MWCSFLFCLWVGLSLSAWAEAAPLPPQAVHLQSAQVRQVLGADGPPPAEVATAELSGDWQSIGLPHAQRHDIVGQASTALASPHERVVTWYRIKLPDHDWGSQPLMLYGARTKAYGPIAVYVDGRRVAQWQLDEVPWYWAPFWLTVDNGQRSAPPREILIRMAHASYNRTALSSMWLGPADAIRWRYLGRDWLQMHVPAMGAGAFLAVGLFAFFIWLKGERDRVFLLFALLGVASFIRGLHYYVSFAVENALLGWLTVNSLFWLVGAVHHLQMLLHQARMPRLTWVIHLIVAVVGVLTLPALGRIPNTPDFTPLVYSLAMLTSPLVAWAGYRLSWGRSSDGMLLATIVAVATLFGFNDWAIQNNLLGPESWYLGPYANILNFAGFCYLIFRYYMRAVHAARQAHADLATRLADKEAELRESYERLRVVERSQTLIDERRRLTQDMHDGLGSSLNTALLAVERGRVDGLAVADILRSCIDDLHLAIDSMEPEHADLLLLLATLRHRLGARLQQAGVTLHWQVSDVPSLPWLDPRKSLHILRILQEALTNSLKHSGASQLWLSTSVEPGAVCVGIRDNGKGFEPQAAQAGGGRGLRNQQRRAESIGASISWHSDARGTLTTLSLPLKPTLDPMFAPTAPRA
jgi:signal transduction histidine kinase